MKHYPIAAGLDFDDQNQGWSLFLRDFSQGCARIAGTAGTSISISGASQAYLLFFI